MEMRPQHGSCKCTKPLVMVVLSPNHWEAYCKRCGLSLTELLNVQNMQGRRIQDAYALSLLRIVTKREWLKQAEILWIGEWLKQRRVVGAKESLHYETADHS